MAVAYDFRILNMSDAVEQFKKIALGCVERQVTNVRRGEETSIRSGLRAGREDGVPLRTVVSAFVAPFPKNAAIRCQNVFFCSFASSR